MANTYTTRKSPDSKAFLYQLSREAVSTTRKITCNPLAVTTVDPVV